MKKNKINKKGQIQLLESTMVMFIFFIIMIVGLMMYSNFQSNKYDLMKHQFDQQKSIKLAQKILSIPELQCSEKNVVTLDCMELQKLTDFSKLAQDNARYYREEFGTSRILVKWVYAPSFSNNYHAPKFFSEENDLNPYVVDNAEEERLILDFSGNQENVDVYYYPVSLWDKRFVPLRSYYGWLIIEVYS